MPRLPVVLGLAERPERRRRHGMRKTRVFGQLLGVQGMVIGDVTMQPDPDGDGEVLVVSVRPDARSGAGARSADGRARGMTPASGPGGGGRWTLVPLAPSWSPRRRGCSARTTVCWWRTCPGPGPARNAPTYWRTPARGWPRTWH